MRRPCLQCGHLIRSGQRCPADHASTAGRGYGGDHMRARAALALTLPTPCGYGCGRMMTADVPWDAAHVVDGDAAGGYMVACRACNVRARQ